MATSFLGLSCSALGFQERWHYHPDQDFATLRDLYFEYAFQKPIAHQNKRAQTISDNILQSVADRKVLFDGKDIVVIDVSSQRSEGIVTFQSWRLAPFDTCDPQRAQGFGERAFASEGLDALHIVARGNHWYQSPEMGVAMDLARDFIATRRAITYGSSMGRYGAIAFGGVLDIPALAFVPQCSLDPAVAPFEKRWRAEYDQIASFDNSLISGPRHKFRGFMFYDPFEPLDRQQVDLLRAATNLVAVPSAFSGHAVPKDVQQSYGLKALAKEVLNGTFAPANYAAARRTQRLDQENYLARLSITLRRTGRGACATTVAAPLFQDKAVTIRPMVHLFGSAMRNRDRPLAQRCLVKARALCDGTFGDLNQLGGMLMQFGEDQEALMTFDAALALAPGNQTITTRRHLLLQRMAAKA